MIFILTENITQFAIFHT